MCGRYTLVRGDTIKVVFNVTVPADLRLVGRYNIAPSQTAPVIANDSGELQLFRWGLIPSWAKDPKIAYKMINARAETLAEKPAFREALARRRCLIPADGFYEWRTGPDGKKTPMYIQMREGELFGFAGLWESWRDPAGQAIRTFTIITTSANELLKPIHDRMPVIIGRADFARWLKPTVMTASEAGELLKPMAAKQMKAHAVAPLVNSPKHEGKELIEPVGEGAMESNGGKRIRGRRGKPKESDAGLFEDSDKGGG